MEFPKWREALCSETTQGKPLVGCRTGAGNQPPRENSGLSSTSGLAAHSPTSLPCGASSELPSPASLSGLLHLPGKMKPTFSLVSPAILLCPSLPRPRSWAPGRTHLSHQVSLPSVFRHLPPSACALALTLRSPCLPATFSPLSSIPASFFPRGHYLRPHENSPHCPLISPFPL